MPHEPIDPETFWADILSEDRDRILDAWRLLNADERIAVRQHLARMAEGEGWTEVQRQSARAALDAIADF